jgi:hypothetical protein
MHNSHDSHLVTRKYFNSDSMELSYLDYGGVSQNVLLMLHGHMNDARTFSEAASKMKDWIRSAWSWLE